MIVSLERASQELSEQLFICIVKQFCCGVKSDFFKNSTDFHQTISENRAGADLLIAGSGRLIRTYKIQTLTYPVSYFQAYRFF